MFNMWDRILFMILHYHGKNPVYRQFLNVCHWEDSGCLLCVFVLCWLRSTESVLFLTAVLSAQMRIEKDRYVIYLDVKHFSPDELSVSIDDEFITVHARHEDRQVRGSLKIQYYAKQMWFKQRHLGDVLIAFTGRPRLCVKGVSEKVQASCWSDKHRCHLQSVSWWRANNHCPTVIYWHRSPYSYFVWRWNSQTENVEEFWSSLHCFATNPKCCLFLYLTCYSSVDSSVLT